MESKDERLDPVSSFTVHSLRLDQDRWREVVSQEDNMAVFNSFFNALEDCHLFICGDPDSGVSVSLEFPHDIQRKVICVSKTGREAVTKENCRKILIFQETQGEDVLDSVVCVTEQVTWLLLSNLDSSSRWVAGVADKALRAMEQQKNEVLVMKAQIEGHTFLPQPDKAEAGPEPDLKLLHACEWMIIDWAELVSEFLQKDSSQAVVDGLKPLPAEEFHFWRNRLKNLLFIQKQLMSSRAQQVASIVQRTESVYWSTLRDIYRNIQEGVDEAQDVTLNLTGLQQKLEEVEQLEYQQLGDKMVSVLEEVRLVWTRSQFYCKPSRMVVLLQEVCNLLIHLSRNFLQGGAVLRGLVSDPGPVMDDVRLVMWTLQNFREAYSQIRTQLDVQNQSWNFPPHLVFIHLDRFLQHLQGLQEALSVSLQLRHLDQAVVSGVSSSMWTSVVQDLYQDFLHHVTVLSDWNRDPTDPDDQDFKLHLDQFQVQVLDLERRLVSVLGGALETCSSLLSAAKLVSMFRSILNCPVIQNQLRPHLVRLVEMVLMELDQTELLFYSHRERPESLSRFSPAAAAGLRWIQQLRLRAEDTMRNYETIQHLCVDSAQSHQVRQRFQQVVDLLQDFRDRLRSDWSSQLDWDCGLILEQPLVQLNQQGMLGVSSSSQLEVILQELWCVSRNRDIELHPHAARLFTCRDDITETYLSLTHMMSCYNQVLNDVLQVEQPLIQDQLEELNQALSELQRNTWGSEGVQQLVEQHRHKVLVFHSSVMEARANMEAMTNIIQGWVELHLLQSSGESLLDLSAAQSSHSCIREDGQELLRLTQVNRSLYGVTDASESWIRYLDHIDDKVQDGLFQLLLRALHFLSENTHPQSCSAALLMVSLQLQETGIVFDPSVGDGLSVVMTTIINDIYTAASLMPRISVGHHSSYQVLLQQNPELCAVEQEVMQHLRQVGEEAERLRAGLDRFSHLWQSDRQAVMQEFLTYSRQLGPEELEAEETPPTLKDFQREIDLLHRLGQEVTHLDEVTVLHGWLQVDLQPFRNSLLSLICTWKNMYTDYLLASVCDSLQQVTRCGDEDSSCSSSFPLTETIILLEAAGVELPEHLSAQLQC